MADGFMDLFSAQVNLPDGRRLHKVRVLFDHDPNGRALLFANRNGPHLAAEAVLTAAPSTAGGKWYLPTAEGNWEVLGACGCASDAKRWDVRVLLQLADQ